MPELLLELYSEEIPARMQRRGADDLKRLVAEGLRAAGLEFEAAAAYATPRRLALFVDGLPEFFHDRDLGCAGRLDGPVDNPSSSCMSCHMTASIPKVVGGDPKKPPIMDFRNQCMSGDKGAQADKKLFKNIAGGERFDSQFAAADYSLQVSEALYQYLGSLTHRNRLRAAMTTGAEPQPEPEPPTSPPSR